MHTALLIVDHGSRLEAANEMLHDVVEVIRRQRPDLIVHPAHMELAEPTIEQGVKACLDNGASEVVVHPYMLSPGRHATQDIPDLANEAGAKFGVAIRVTGPLGIHDKIGEVVLERAGLAAPQMTSSTETG